MFHQKIDEKQAEEVAVQMLGKVGLGNPRERLQNYPFELSGGQRQRVIIAIGISCNPEILIADEPTTALDVTVQAQILELMKDLQSEYHSGLIFITHDLAVIAEMADKVMVMYGGKTMEYADVYTIFEKPQHPYSKLLLECIPRLDIRQNALNPIPGQPPTMLNAPNLCPFLPRCPRKTEECLKRVPPLEEIDENHFVRCFNPYGTKTQVVNEKRADH
jgi:peptide/nickel transport system ATP-binding protein